MLSYWSWSWVTTDKGRMREIWKDKVYEVEDSQNIYLNYDLFWDYLWIWIPREWSWKSLKVYIIMWMKEMMYKYKNKKGSIWGVYLNSRTNNGSVLFEYKFCWKFWILVFVWTLDSYFSFTFSLYNYVNPCDLSMLFYSFLPICFSQIYSILFQWTCIGITIITLSLSLFPKYNLTLTIKIKTTLTLNFLYIIHIYFLGF